MAILQPLGKNFQIVDEKGQPTDYFIRWAQQRQIDIGLGVTREQAEELITEEFASRQVIAGDGLAGGGYLSGDVTLNLNAHLDDLIDVNLGTPPVEGQVLVFQGGVFIAGPAGIEEAPLDGKIYARKDGTWVEITSEGGGGGSPAHSPHLYWRVLVPSGEGYFAVAMAELKMRSEVGGLNVAIGGTPFSSTPFSSDNQAPKAFDNNNSTYWAANIGGGETSTIETWLGYQFATPTVIEEISITSRSDVGRQTPRNFTVQWSDDGSNYANAWTVSGLPVWTNGQTTAFANTAP